MSARHLTTRPFALALLLLAVVGATAGWKATEKTVTVSVDGISRQLSTHAGSVRALLQQAHLSVGPHDVLAPGLGSHLADGSQVVLRRGRQFMLVVDGVPREVWVTATSVDEALGQIGLRTVGALLSADRSRVLPLRGFSLEVRLPKRVTVLDAGRALHVTSTGLQLSDALADLHLILRPADRIDLPVHTVLTDGLTARVTRIDGRSASTDLPVPFATTSRPDPTSYVGTSHLGSPGRAGVRHRVFALGYVDHRLVSKRLTSDRVTVPPSPRVVLVGSLARPVPVVSYQPPVYASTSSSGGLNFGALANCESGGNPRAVSSGGDYRGLYQFSFGTWQGVGGSGDPIDAFPAEQTNRAQILYSRGGRSSWPTCGRYL